MSPRVDWRGWLWLLGLVARAGVGLLLLWALLVLMGTLPLQP